MNWKEFDIFYHFPFYNISLSSEKIDNSKLLFNKKDEICRNNFKNLEGKRYKNEIYFEYIWCDIITKLLDNKSFLKNAKKYIPYKNYNKIVYTYYLYFYIFNKLLLINKPVKEKVKNFILRNKKYLGIQMRMGNSDLRERHVCTKNDTDIMIKLASNNFTKMKWFLTGDSMNLKMSLKYTYKNIILYSINKTKHFNKYPNDSTTVIEHEILSKSKYFIISRSTFGLTALLKSGVLLCRRKIMCYEVKKGKAYNILNEFITFHNRI